MTTALAVIGGVVAGIGAIAQGQAAAQAAQYNAQTAEYNAKVAERNRIGALDQAGAEMADKRRENRRQIAMIRAAYGHAGIDMAGSPLDVLEDTAMEQELDVARIGYQGALRGQGYTDEAANQRRQKGLDEMEGRAARIGGWIGGAAGFLGGARNAYQGATLLRA